MRGLCTHTHTHTHKQTHTQTHTHTHTHTHTQRKTTVKDCNFCKRTKKAGEKAFSSCARCRAVRYCSSECQQKDWKAHKDTCAPSEKSKAPLNLAQKECQTHMIAAQRCRRARDRVGEGRAYRMLGAAFFRLGQFRKAIEFHTKDLSISRKLGDRAGEGIALCNLGAAFNSLSQPDKAVEFVTKFLSISREAAR
jgi:tetratricopeptide (TPR) repeat protein